MKKPKVKIFVIENPEEIEIVTNEFIDSHNVEKVLTVRVGDLKGKYYSYVVYIPSNFDNEELF